MEGILPGIPGVCVYIDNILVTGETKHQNFKTLDKVLDRLNKEGVRLKREKCACMLPSVKYLMHKILAAGLQPEDEKVRAIADAPTPHNVTQLHSFLGLVNYYGKFFPQLASTLAPLFQLLQKKSVWKWGTDQQKVFEEAKA